MDQIVPPIYQQGFPSVLILDAQAPVMDLQKQRCEGLKFVFFVLVDLGEPGVYRETQTDKAKLVSQRESVQSVFTAEQIASIPASAYDNARTAPTIAINASPYLTDSNDSAKSDYEMIVNKSRAALLREKFVDKNQLREMYIYREIFDKPVALRRQR